MNKKENLKFEIGNLIDCNIKRHYQYIQEKGLLMNDFNKKFIPLLLKELNKDINEVIDKIYGRKKSKKKDKLESMEN